MERQINELKRGDLFVYANKYQLYFGGLTKTERKDELVLHATDSSGDLLRFRVKERDSHIPVRLLKEAAETVNERHELTKFMSLFCCKLPQLAWLF